MSRKKRDFYAVHIKDTTPVGSRKKTGYKKLSTSDICDILHKVLVKYEMQKDVAKEYRISPKLVSQYVVKSNKNSEYLREMLAKRDEYMTLRNAICEVVASLLENKIHLYNAEMV